MERFDIIRVPFPYSDVSVTKIRPALVVSDAALFNGPSEHVVAVMITSAERSSFPLDIHLKHYQTAGLLKPCLVRMKFFTAAKSMVLGVVGSLHPDDRQTVAHGLRTVLSLQLNV